jgi:DNA-binding response OmpR family regulator
MRLLLVEDDDLLGPSLKKSLEKAAYGVDLFTNGESGLEAALSNDYCVIILDIHLPRICGLTVTRTLRRSGSKAAILMLTAMDDMANRIKGLDNGADDYITKPFDLYELLARVRALRRRHTGQTESLITCGDVELDPVALVVRRNGQKLPISGKEFQALRILMERQGRYVPKRDLEYALYDTDSTIESNTIEVTIYTLRKKLGNNIIKCMRGVGYTID